MLIVAREVKPDGDEALDSFTLEGLCEALCQRSDVLGHELGIASSTNEQLLAGELELSAPTMVSPQELQRGRRREELGATGGIEHPLGMVTREQLPSLEILHGDGEAQPRKIAVLDPTIESLLDRSWDWGSRVDRRREKNRDHRQGDDHGRATCER